MTWENIADYGLKIMESNTKAKEWNNRGLSALGITQYENAIECFNKAIELNSDYADAYNNRGTAYKYLKHYEKAIEDYNKAIELNTNYTMAYHNRGLAYKDIGQQEKAKEDFNKAKTIEQKKKEPTSWGTPWSEVIFGGIISGIIAGLFGFLGKGATIFVMFIFFMILISAIEPKGRGFLAAIIMAAISGTIFSLISFL